MSVDRHRDATAIHALAAQGLDRGFRLLTLREFLADDQPPAFAWIEQRLLRTPERSSRHGLWFANTFLPEVMAWLGDDLGRPSLHDASGAPYRNPRWPSLAWTGEARSWPEGERTVEWFVDVIFPDEGSWTRFRARWRARLAGVFETLGA